MQVWPTGQVLPVKCRLESAVPKVAIGHQSLKRDRKGAMLLAIGGIVSKGSGVRKEGTPEPSSPQTSHNKAVQGWRQKSMAMGGSQFPMDC